MKVEKETNKLRNGLLENKEKVNRIELTSFEKRQINLLQQKRTAEMHPIVEIEEVSPKSSLV